VLKAGAKFGSKSRRVAHRLRSRSWPSLHPSVGLGLSGQFGSRLNSRLPGATTRLPLRRDSAAGSQLMGLGAASLLRRHLAADWLACASSARTETSRVLGQKCRPTIPVVRAILPPCHFVFQCSKNFSIDAAISDFSTLASPRPIRTEMIFRPLRTHGGDGFGAQSGGVSPRRRPSSMASDPQFADR
jgi:hypothetical protein